MMLSTDLCLAYSENGVPVNSGGDAQHDCCAWMDPPSIGGGLDPTIIGNNGGELCGVLENPSGNPPLPEFGDMRAACCDASTEKEQNPSFNGKPRFEDDCGVPINLASQAGYAPQAVIDFAKDDQVWAKEFLD